MTTITVLPKELMSAVRWAFRARQIPASYAHPVGRLVLQAQLLRGVGLAQVVEILQAGGMPQDMELVRDEAGLGMVNGRSQPPLFCLWQLFDFAAARAAQQGSYRLQVTNLSAVSAPLIEAMLIQLGEQGFVGWVETAVSEFYGVVPHGQPPVVMGILTQERGLFDQVTCQAGASNVVGDHAFTLFCTRELLVTELPSADVVTQTQQQAWERAYRQGIPIEAPVWATLKAIASEILIGETD